MKIIAVTHIKGGVGKTTTCVNLAYLCAASGLETIVWDLDAQGAATYLLHGEPAERVPARKLVAGKRELPELVTRTPHAHLDLLPADFSYRNFDVHLAERKHPTERLLRMTRSLRERYAALFLDCPPGISLLSENVLRAADALVIPLLPTPLSLRTLEQLRDFVTSEGWSDLRLLPFFSMVDRRRSLHRELIAQSRARFRELLATELPYWSDIERMSEQRGPLPALAPRSVASILYVRLWCEIRERLGELANPVSESAPERARDAPPTAPSPEAS